MTVSPIPWLLSWSLLLTSTLHPSNQPDFLWPCCLEHVLRETEPLVKIPRWGENLPITEGSPGEWVLPRGGGPTVPRGPPLVGWTLLSPKSLGHSLFSLCMPSPFCQAIFTLHWTDKYTLLAPTKIFHQESAELAPPIQGCRGYKRPQKCWPFHSGTK